MGIAAPNFSTGSVLSIAKKREVETLRDPAMTQFGQTVKIGSSAKLFMVDPLTTVWQYPLNNGSKHDMGQFYNVIYIIYHNMCVYIYIPILSDNGPKSSKIADLSLKSLSPADPAAAHQAPRATWGSSRNHHIPSIFHPIKSKIIKNGCWRWSIPSITFHETVSRCIKNDIPV